MAKKTPNRLNELKDDVRACMTAFLNQPSGGNLRAVLAAIDGYRPQWEQAKLAALLGEDVDDEAPEAQPETPSLKSVA